VLLTVHCDAHDEERKDPGVGHEEQVVVVVCYAHAVVNPRAVVIVAFHAGLAYRAMTGSWGLNDFAVWAELCGLKFLKKLQEFELRVSLKLARVLSDREDVRDVHLDPDHSRRHCIVPLRVGFTVTQS
jgi:hypothetical protein